jgi:hypothetical protein
VRRRTYLAALAAAGLAGCATGADTSPSRVDPETPTPAPVTPTATEAVSVPRLSGVELPLPRSAFVRAAPENAIPAVTDPAFAADWSGVEIPGLSGDAATPRLDPGDRVVGVERDGRARAYPLRVLRAHEVVNDGFGGPLLVTYCPLCGSGVTAVRRVGGAVTEFGVSGLLWRSDLVLYDDRTGSLWSQLLAAAVDGPATGRELALVPSTLTSLGGWRDAHPDTEVLLPPPVSDTVTGSASGLYGDNPYASYRDSETVGVGLGAFEDDRLDAKTVVLGVSHEGTSVAYPLPAVREAGVVNDTVGGRPVVVTVAPGDTLVAFDRRADGRRLRFTAGGEETLRAGGSRWERLTGRAVSGAYEGTTLSRANDRSQLFWFAWLDFTPRTTVYRG